MNIFGYPATPAWEDKVLTTAGTPFENFDAVDFKIDLIGQGNTVLRTLFSGFAVRRPGAALIDIRVNDIVAGLLRPSFPPLDADSGYVDAGQGTDARPGLAKLFKVTWSDPAGVESDATVFFSMYADWSYKSDERMVRSLPVDGIVSPRQWMLTTAMRARALSYGATMADVEVPAVFVKPDESPATYWDRASVVRAGLADPDAVFYPAMIRSIGAGGAAVGLDENTPLRFGAECARWVVYYLNAAGGWDWYVFQGTVRERQDIERETYVRRGARLSTNVITGPGTDVILADVSRRFELNTAWLTDDQAARLQNLISSPAVYLHDLDEGDIFAVTVTDNQHEIKTYAGEGGRLVSYAINVEAANINTRR